ncbi:tRNA (adenosine(37)-N6)-dimethylallyltransferase MiaA [uncultured Rikenella sp.]|uniref:tRNA (adenosine(37)-N6)-dimethylallyltransferase MiaA n=1 Tax=uncultured Rikenella sp. TaxID=368003 RepID=UPI002616CC96|nr:tRNA (adenosine(37)-N6)-dimethylallyltransferase MiaA [uncultured Rikenella sp.]
MTTSTERRLIVIQGPTGVGKTAAGVALARHYGIPVVSADSRQVYREMTVGTAVPSVSEREGVPHYFIQNKSIHEPFTAGDYEREVLALLDGELFPAFPAVLAVGGSGLYISALLDGFDDLPEADPTLRSELSSTPLDDLLKELEQTDPRYFAVVDRQNPQRVIRAVEVCRLSGKPYSALRSGMAKQRSFTTLKIGLTLPREELYERIDRRVDLMLESGLLSEAERLYPDRHLPALQTVGYRELFDCFDGKTSLDEAVERIKRNTRRYAKRQLTWLRRDPQIRWFGPDETEKMIVYIDGHH